MASARPATSIKSVVARRPVCCGYEGRAGMRRRVCCNQSSVARTAVVVLPIPRMRLLLPLLLEGLMVPPLRMQLLLLSHKR